MLRRGDLVCVKQASEILETLDGTGSVDGLPFMPEMVEFCGRSFRVVARVEKSCNTVGDFGSLRFADTVMLDSGRCDGTAHDECEADCALYWREAWLRPAHAAAADSTSDEHGMRRLRAIAQQNAREARSGEAVYRCQATCMLQASACRLATIDPRQYVREYRAKNRSRRQFATVMVRAVRVEGLRKIRPSLVAGPSGTASKSPRLERLDLKPGELVQVRSEGEIL